ncbi:MAG: cyclase family protein [Nitrosopumilus sp.]
MPKIIDISISLDNETLVHPSEEFLKIEPNRTFEKDGVRTSKITFGSHTGTHIDAPSHFLEKGKTIDEINLDKCMGKCQVVEISEELQTIEKEHIEGKINSKRVLFKTKNSKLLNKPYTKNITSLSISAAQYLIERSIVLVGIDYTGIEASGSPGHPVHTKLLENEIVIVEGLNLADVNAGNYELIVLPLKLKGLDGSPSRAVLIKD